MRTRIGTVALGALILVLVAANAVLFSGLRSYYVLSKQQPAEPHNIERFAAANAALDRSRPLLVWFGDSRIARWSPLPDAGDRAISVNRGISGETTEQMRLRFADDVLSLEPAVVVIQAGINDLVAASLSDTATERRIVARCIANLETFARQAAAAGSRVVILEIVGPAQVPLWRLPFWDDSIRTLVAEVNARLEALDDGRDIIVESLEPALMTETGQWRAGLAADTLHYTADGYAAMNRRLSPLLESLLADALQ